MGVGEKCEHIGFFRLQFYALNTSQTGVSVASVCPQYLRNTKFSGKRGKNQLRAVCNRPEKSK